MLLRRLWPPSPPLAPPLAAKFFRPHVLGSLSSSLTFSLLVLSCDGYFKLQNTLSQCFQTFFELWYICYIGKILRHTTNKKCYKMTLCKGRKSFDCTACYTFAEMDETARARIVVFHGYYVGLAPRKWF